jgi:hypothetical protein
MITHLPVRQHMNNFDIKSHSSIGITSSSYKTTAHQQPIQRSYDNALSG